MKNAYPLIASMATALLLAIALPTQAQPGPGMGQGMGPGYGAGQGAGMGQGYGRGRGFAFNNTNSRGWSLMTAEERTAHRDKMWSAKSYEECKDIQEGQHKVMTERAKEQGKALPMPRRNACDRMRANGYYK